MIAVDLLLSLVATLLLPLVVEDNGMNQSIDCCCKAMNLNEMRRAMRPKDERMNKSKKKSKMGQIYYFLLLTTAMEMN